MKVKFTLGIGYSGAVQEEVVEIEDGLTEDEIYEELNEWQYQFIDAGFEILGGDGECNS